MEYLSDVADRIIEMDGACAHDWLVAVARTIKADVGEREQRIARMHEQADAVCERLEAVEHGAHNVSPRVRPPQENVAVPDAHVKAAALFKKLFVPVTYAEQVGDSLERRMLKKIYNVAAAVKHRGDGTITETELRTIHSAAFAGVDGPDPDYEL